MNAGRNRRDMQNAKEKRQMQYFGCQHFGCQNTDRKRTLKLGATQECSQVYRPVRGLTIQGKVHLGFGET